MRIGVYFIAGCYAIAAVPLGINIANNFNSKGKDTSSKSSASPAKELPPEAAHDNAVFSAMIDYLEEKVGLSDYDTTALEDQAYIEYDENGNYTECIAQLPFKNKEHFSAPSGSIRLNGNVEVTPDKTTVGYLLGCGYSLAEGTPISLESGKSISIHLFYNSKAVSACVENNSSSSLRISNCVITSVYLYPSTDVGFNYQGLNNGSDMDDILSVLRKPNSYIYLYSSNDYNEISFRYSYADGTDFLLDFEYVYSTKRTKLKIFTIG